MTSDFNKSDVGCRILASRVSYFYKTDVGCRILTSQMSDGTYKLPYELLQRLQLLINCLNGQKRKIIKLIWLRKPYFSVEMVFLFTTYDLRSNKTIFFLQLTVTRNKAQKLELSISIQGLNIKKNYYSPNKHGVIFTIFIDEIMYSLRKFSRKKFWPEELAETFWRPNLMKNLGASWLQGLFPKVEPWRQSWWKISSNVMYEHSDDKRNETKEKGKIKSSCSSERLALNLTFTKRKTGRFAKIIFYFLRANKPNSCTSCYSKGRQLGWRRRDASAMHIEFWGKEET